MKRRFDQILTIIVLLLGLIHIILTPNFYPEFNDTFMWFAGTGLAFVYAGIINLIRLNTSLKFIWIFSITSNTLLSIYTVGLMFAFNQIAPQGIFSLVIVLLLFVFNILHKNYNIRASKI